MGAGADPQDLILLQGPGPDGLGNLIYRRGEGESARVLKLYRRRWPRWQEWTEAAVSRLFLGTTARTARARYETERRCLDLWAREGFDVFRRFDDPLPLGSDPPGLWLEYCPGKLLLDLLRDAAAPWGEKLGLIGRMGEAMGRRHERAEALGEPLLVQKHGTTEHILLYRGRMITVDLEGSFRSGFPILEALAQELSGYLRSVAKNSGGLDHEALERFAAGYPSKDLLRRIAAWAVHGRGLHRRITRFQDRRRRSEHGKTEVLARVLEIIG